MLKRYHGEADTASFDVLPAIDILGGRVVRLREGNFDEATTFSSDPLTIARQFRDAGARWLHVVDLDGARAGEPRQAEIIDRIVREVGDAMRIEVAGGLRSREAVDRALTKGAYRVVIGTAALTNTALVADLVAADGSDAVVIAIDVRDGLAVGEGWHESAAGKRPENILLELASVGARWFAVTAIERDGRLEGPDLRLLRRLISLGAGRIIASGGIASIDDLMAVREAGCAGAIVGRAIYEGRVDLRRALAAVPAS